MTLLDTRTRFGLVSRALHWIIVVAIVAQWLLAETGEDSRPVYGSSYTALTLHQSIGLVVLLLAVVRVAWRGISPKPAWAPDMKPYEIALARVVHVAFYVLLFAIPITGWALASVEDEPLRFFNWLDVPRLRLAGEDTLEEAHEALFNILAALALLHVLGAAKHWIAGRLETRGGHS